MLFVYLTLRVQIIACLLYTSFQNDLKFTKEKFIQRLKSASYMIPEDSPNYEAYISALENLFDKYQKNGFNTMPKETKSYAGEI